MQAGLEFDFRPCLTYGQDWGPRLRISRRTANSWQWLLFDKNLTTSVESVTIDIGRLRNSRKWNGSLAIRFISFFASIGSIHCNLHQPLLEYIPWGEFFSSFLPLFLLADSITPRSSTAHCRWGVSSFPAVGRIYCIPRSLMNRLGCVYKEGKHQYEWWGRNLISGDSS